MAWIIWVGAGLILGILELLTVDLFFLTLGLSALGSGLLAVFGVSIWVQIAFFVASSALLLAFVRPWARDLLHRSTPDVTTNAQAYVGKTAIVTAPLGGGTGRVKIGGEDWSASGQDGLSFPVGSHVRVVRIDGATAVVGPFDEAVPTPPDSTPS